jgi:hypothetical protein
MYFKIFLECFILTNETKIPQGSYWERVTTLVCDIVETSSVLVKIYLIRFENTAVFEKYKAYLPADTGTYSSAKLQDRLVKHYAGSIVIHTQWGQGMSNLVFSDKLSLGNAIAAAGKYKSKFKASELENEFQVDVEGISDEQILHSAVGICKVTFFVMAFLHMSLP